MSSKPDLSEFYRYSQPRKKPCPVQFAREQLGSAEQAQLDAACRDESGLITSAAIVRWLGERSYDINVNAISAHRRRVCTCAKRT